MTFRDLIIWQKSKDLVKVVYSLTEAFPDEERYGLKSQMRRSAVSIPSNIAEGYGRRLKTDFIRFLRISSGSLCELQTQAEIARELGYIENESCDFFLVSANEIERMLSAFIGKLNTSGVSDRCD